MSKSTKIKIKINFYTSWKKLQNKQIILIKSEMFLSHHGVKQCFHTMDVAVSDWATSEMGPAGPTSVKSVSLMKNNLILVTKHCKKKKEKHMRRRRLLFLFFPSSVAGFFFITPWTTKTASTKAKKKSKT